MTSGQIRSTHSIRPVVARIRRLARQTGNPIVVALDGRSGAGKSTIAARLSEELDAARIPCDDFFAAEISDSEWDARSARERASDALDWRRLVADVIVPLRAGTPARWRAFDFAAGPRADGTYALQAAWSQQSPRPIVLLDGAIPPDRSSPT